METLPQVYGTLSRFNKKNATSPFLEMQRFIGNMIKFTGKRRTLFQKGIMKKGADV